ncbi:glycosyltransferase family 39 protein [Candidatus Babeliales bacterium]|nr:glycosyltransferase family 39 protein [Candidatus Babeliales bacterium]
MNLTHKFLITCFSGIYLALSLLLYQAIPPTNSHMDGDSHSYHELALQFSQKNLLIDKNSPSNIPMHTNGYPFFLAFIYKIFGSAHKFVIIIQVVLALCSGFLIYSIAKKLFSKAVALIAFFLFSWNLGFIIFPQFILAEALLVFLLIFSFERLTAYQTNNSLFALSLSGLLLGLSIIVKPVALYYFPLLALYLFASNKSLKKALLFALCFAIPVTGYMASNNAAYGSFSISPLVNANLYLWFHAKIRATENNTTHIEELSKLEKLIDGNKLNPQSWSKLKQEFFSLLQSKLSLAIKVWTREVIKSLLGLYVTNLKVLTEPKVHGGDISFFSSSDNSIWSKITTYITAGTSSRIIKAIGFLEAFWNLIRYLLVLFAFFILYKKRCWSLLILLGSYLFYFSMITGHDGCARYRFMFEYILILLSALSIHTIYLTIKNNLFRSLCETCFRETS